MRTEENLSALVAALQQNLGDLHLSARQVGLSPMFVTTWCRDDPEVAKTVEEAQRVGYMGIESEAMRRAVRGVQEDVWYKGDVVGEKTVYSDTLLAKLLEAKVDGFRKGEDTKNVFNGPVQINHMPRANTYDEWLAMKDKTLERRQEREALPAPALPDILVGEYVEVANPLEGLGI